MRTGTRGLLAVAALLLFADGVLARGIHSIVEDASGRTWDKKIEQGETLRIDVNADGIDFATGVRTSTPLVTAKIVRKRNGTQNNVGGRPIGQATVELKAAANATVAPQTLIFTVGPNAFYDMFKASEERISFSVLARGTGPAPTVSVSKGQRDAVVFLANLVPDEQPAKAFYEFVQFSAEGAVTVLTPVYRRVHLVKGRNATLAALVGQLNAAASNSAVKAVDLIFVTHGLSDEVVFSDRRASMDAVRMAIESGLSATDRAKLRAVFSTACYGASHRTDWRSAGFNVVSGSRKIYADSALSYGAFLAAWASGQSFASAINIANGSDPLDAQDQAATPVLRKFGFSEEQAKDVDSFRVISGTGDLTINMMN
ncbi:MAG TPA: hypothetical protein VNC59_09485 [Thermoanaerobaculia bacterium]|nr:hypothetical protein [Thermoanaerobaculia bacterium]